MKVILLADIKGVGRKNDLVNVAEGYAMNFLFPKRLGMQATPAGIAKHDAMVKGEKAEIERLTKLVRLLEKEPLIMGVKTGIHGEVFDSVTKDDIRKELEAKGHMDIRDVHIDKPIRIIGDTKATIRFAHGIEGNIVIRTEGVDKSDKK